MHPGQNRSAGVMHLHHAAFGDAPRLRILRMHPQRLAPLNFGLPADAAVIVLAVQTRARLAGEQMQRPAAGLFPLPARLFFVPPRMAGALAVAEVGDGLREELNLAGRRGRAARPAGRRENRPERPAAAPARCTPARPAARNHQTTAAQCPLPGPGGATHHKYAAATPRRFALR
nr:Uncharacterised protein [Raoultella sp. NCTC 9187]